MFSAVPNATVHTSINNVVIKTLLNSSATTLCGPLCPAVSLRASWQQHSGAPGSPMMTVHVECTNCPVNIGNENLLAMELIVKCVQVRNSLSKYTATAVAVVFLFFLLARDVIYIYLVSVSICLSVCL